MTVTREQFRSSYTWDEWLDTMEERHAEAWRHRYRRARLGEIRADFQDVRTPRYVLCIVDADGADSLGTVPYIAKACEQAAAAGGVALRIAPRGRGPDLVDQFRTDAGAVTPICIVFDEDWIQIGLWGPRPGGADALVDGHAPSTPDARRRLEEWYETDRGRSTLREFLPALRGQAPAPWRSNRELGEHQRKQADRARRRP